MYAFPYVFLVRRRKIFFLSHLGGSYNKVNLGIISFLNEKGKIFFFLALGKHTERHTSIVGGFGNVC